MSGLSDELWRALLAGFVEVVCVLDGPPRWRLTVLHLPALETS
mgnify:CR=1 FL=1